MKKSLILVSVLLVTLVALVVVGAAFAQTPNPATPYAPFGRGMMGGGYGMMGRGGSGMMGRGGSYGVMHPYMVAALAEELGMTAEDLQARLDAGETMYQVLQSEGLSDTEVQDVLNKAHTAALAGAVEAGALTQEQADWMNSHMQSMWSFGGGFGGCHGRGTGGARWTTPSTTPAS